jgi:hypothetical protein
MKRRKPKSDRQIIKQIFPPEIVQELDNVLEEIDSSVPVRKNPRRKGARPIKPWSKSWTGEKR